MRDELGKLVHSLRFGEVDFELRIFEPKRNKNRETRITRKKSEMSLIDIGGAAVCVCACVLLCAAGRSQSYFNLHNGLLKRNLMMEKMVCQFCLYLSK